MCNAKESSLRDKRYVLPIVLGGFHTCALHDDCKIGGTFYCGASSTGESGGFIFKKTREQRRDGMKWMECGEK